MDSKETSHYHTIKAMYDQSQDLWVSVEVHARISVYGTCSDGFSSSSYVFSMESVKCDFPMDVNDRSNFFKDFVTVEDFKTGVSFVVEHYVPAT